MIARKAGEEQGMERLLRDEIVAVTSELIAFESVAERPEQLHAVIDYADAYVRRIPGLQISRHERAGKPSLVVTLRETRRPRVFLNAHLDVVPARPAQFRPEVQGDRLWGRGSQDMKGSGAVLLRLIKDLAALESPPDVGFQFVSDEEIGGAHGVGLLIDQGFHCDFFIAPEPTDLGVCHLSKGIMWIELRFAGDPCHGSRPWDGRNGILALRDGLCRLEQAFPTPSDEIWRTTVTPTVVQGGSATNRLPEQVTLRLDVRYVPDDDPQAVVAAVRDCFPTAELIASDPGPPLLTRADNPFVLQLAAASQAVVGAAPRLYGEHYATDARYYSEIGTPAVCYGPVGKGLHSDDEWVDIPSLLQLHGVLRRFALEI
jgi:succinyl-diaminopimelate desuccinylase